MSHSSLSHQLYERTLALTIALYRVTDYFPKAEVLRNHLRSKANEVFEQITEYSNSTDDLNAEIEALIQKIKTVKGYLTIAGTLNYVRSVNFTILEKEYSLIEQFLQNEKVQLIKQQIDEDIKNLNHTHVLHSLSGKSLENRQEKAAHSKVSRHEAPYQAGRKDVVREEGETVSHNLGFYERSNEELNERQKVIMDHLKKSGQAKISDFYPSFNGVSSKTIQRDLQYLVDRQILKKEGEKRWTIYSLSIATSYQTSDL